MSLFVYGQVADDLGHIMPSDGSIRAIPADRYAKVQPGHIVVDCHHDGDEIGSVIHLERRHRHLQAVVELRRLTTRAARLIQGDCWFSGYLAFNRDNTIRLEALSLTDSPGSVGLAPLRVTTRLDPQDTNTLLKTAAVEHRSWHRPDTLTIDDGPAPAWTHTEQRGEAPVYARPPGPIEFSAPYPGIISVGGRPARARTR